MQIPSLREIALLFTCLFSFACQAQTAPGQYTAEPTPLHEETAITNVDEPISPAVYAALLGKGMDVDWARFRNSMEGYSQETVKDFKEVGLSHVRIRVKDDLSPQLFEVLDQRIADCLEFGLIPILAYQADEFKLDPSAANQEKMVEWWRQAAEHYQDYPHLLSFDILIEATDAVNQQPEALNRLYEAAVTVIRGTNPTRIIFISPRLRSAPEYLSELEIPTAHNGYLMAEWHFYASGPDKTNPLKKWTTGTEQEKQLIIDKIQSALSWQKQAGIYTWVGAWMPGNYNKGDDYLVKEQVIFAKFTASQLDQAGIPYAINSDIKFYDYTTSNWIDEMFPVLQAVLVPK